jgi:hypothetical protein
MTLEHSFHINQIELISCSTWNSEGRPAKNVAKPVCRKYEGTMTDLQVGEHNTVDEGAARTAIDRGFNFDYWARSKGRHVLTIMT